MTSPSGFSLSLWASRVPSLSASVMHDCNWRKKNLRPIFTHERFFWPFPTRSSWIYHFMTFFSSVGTGRLTFDMELLIGILATVILRPSDYNF